MPARRVVKRASATNVRFRCNRRSIWRHPISSGCRPAATRTQSNRITQRGMPPPPPPLLPAKFGRPFETIARSASYADQRAAAAAATNISWATRRLTRATKQASKRCFERRKRKRKRKCALATAAAAELTSGWRFTRARNRVDANCMLT